VIEPEYAARIGLADAIPAADHHRAERAAACLATLGIAHCRLPIEAADLRSEAGLDGIDRLLRLLGDVCDVLPVLHYTPAHAADHMGDLERLLNRLGAAADSVELAIPAMAVMDVPPLRAAIHRIRQAGKRAVLGLAPETCSASLRLLGEDGSLDACDAVTLHGSAFLPESCAAARHAARCYHPVLRLFVTGACSADPRDDDTAQTRAFQAALEIDADRLYWHSIFDTEASATGLFDSLGAPRLLGRLLARGVAGLARAMPAPAPAILATRPVLVTGGAGFIGANLADRLAAAGHTVLVYDALSRPGVERNLDWLSTRHPGKIAVAVNDIRDDAALTEAAATASAVFHLAAQVAVTTSLVRPVEDFAINLRGTLTLLEALRCRNRAAPLIFASTNKVYGDLADIALIQRGDQYQPEDATLRARGIDETRPLCFHTPYGCSKGAADQYVLDYAQSFGLRTAVLRMSCIYGERQFGTEDQGWLAHFLLRAIAGEPITLYGDGCQVRDVLHVGDAIGTYIAAWENIDRIAGRAFNLGGGPANAISLLQLIAHIETLLGRPVDVSFEDWRAGDQRYFVADATAVRTTLGLPTPLGWREGVARLAAHFGAAPAHAPVREAAL
jgi:CDP-paratose 2-epimerase